MKKIVAGTLIVIVQLLVGALFLVGLINSDNKKENLVVVDNNNLSKMAQSVNDLFVTKADLLLLNNNDKQAEEELITTEEAEKQRVEELAKKEAEEKAKAEAEAKAKAEAEEKAKAEAEAKAAEEAKRVAAASVSQSVQELQNYAHSLVIDSYGWTETDFKALVNLWNKESGWNVHCYNSYSGAYGIPQALPGSKMATEGTDYETNGETQIRWGLKYIKGRYGSPSAAWQHFLDVNWY